MHLGISLGLTGGGQLSPAQRYDYLITGDADVATVNGATLAGGERIGVARGSVLTAQLTLAADNLLVEAYGSGATPEFRCDDDLSSGGWTKTVGLTNVYERTITLPGDAKVLGNVWEDDDFLTLVTSTANCDATAGSAYVSDWTAASATLYVHPSDGGAPATNGKAYSYSARSHGIKITGNGARVTGVLTRRNAHQDGSLVVYGEDAAVNNCRAEDGNRHCMLLGAGAAVSNTYFYRARNDLEAGGSANLLVVYQDAIQGKAYTTSNCTFDGGDQPSVSALSNHGSNAAHLFESIVHTDDTFINCANGLSASAEDCQVVRPVLDGVATFVSLGPAGAACTVQGATGDCSKLYEEQSAGCSFTSQGNVLAVPALAAGFYLSNQTTADHTLVIDGDEITVTAEAVVANPAELIRVARGTVTVGALTVGPALAPPIDTLVRVGFSSQTVTFASSGCTYPRGVVWIVNGTTYRSVAAIQTATLDTGSTLAPMPTASFSDDFNRANENLEASASWTRVGGAAAQAAVRSNNLSFIGTTQTLYHAPDLGEVDHYVKGTVRGVPATANSFPLDVRAADQSNWLGVRWSSTAYIVSRCVAGTITQIVSSTTVTPTAGDDVVLAVRGTQVTLTVNDVAVLVNGAIGDSGSLAANTKAGVVPRGATLDPAIDDFACGAL